MAREGLEGMIESLGLSADEGAAAREIYAAIVPAALEELARVASQMARRPSSELLGAAEFEVRDAVHRIGAQAIEASANQRRKKGGTLAAASSASSASGTPSSSAGGRRRSSA
jgi:hypothetical protein